MASANGQPDPDRPTRRPARTLEGREKQMVALAVDLAERQLSQGTASSQVIVHYLKLGSTREQLEQLKMEKEIALADAKVEQIASGKRIEELYGRAIEAMRAYGGGSSVPEVEE